MSLLPNAESSIRRSNTNTTTAKTFTLLFIRHGISCANLRKERTKKQFLKDHTSIMDPGLTRGGIIKATERGAMLRQALADPPLVCASTLVRAQQTALFMLDPWITPENKLHILPYMSEVGLFKTRDNTPRPLPDQLEFLRRQGISDIEHRLDTSNLGVPDANTPSLGKFKEFLGGFLAGEEDGQTVVLFTHGNFIAKLLKSLGYPIAKSDRPNYVAYKIVGEIGGDGELTMSLSSPAPEFTYAPAGLDSQTGDAYRYKYYTSRALTADIECRLEAENKGACEADVCSLGATMSGGSRGRGRSRRTSNRHRSRHTRKATRP